jgi:hypothetical protein
MEVYTFITIKVSVRILKIKNKIQNMKNTCRKSSKKNKIIFSFTLLVISVFMISCEIPTDPQSILELRIDTNVFTHKGFIQIKDLENQENLAGNILTAKVITDDARQDLLVTEGGLFINKPLSLRDGISAFAVNPKYRGFTDPIKLSLEITGAGYLTKTISVVIRPQDSVTIIKQAVLNIKKVPTGVAAVQKRVSLSGGSNNTSIIATTNSSTINTAAEVVVPLGNTFKDISGNTIANGDLSIQVIYFDGSNTDAIRASNNNDVRSIKDENGAVLTNISIAPVATAEINMNVGSTEVKAFEKPIDVFLDVNSDFINPNTGMKVKLGDKFKLYSTSSNQDWEFQSEVEIVNLNGKLGVKFNTNHLSTFTLGVIVDSCEEETTFIPLADNGSGFSSGYIGKFVKLNGAFIKTTALTKATRFGVVGLVVSNVPSEDANLIISTQADTLLGETGMLSWCSDIVNVSSNAIRNLKLEGKSVALNVSVTCSGSAAIKPSGVAVYIEYTAGTGKFTEGGILDEGRVTIPGITLGRDYKLRVYYNGDFRDGTYTFDSENVDILNYELPGDVCAELGL